LLALEEKFKVLYLNYNITLLLHNYENNWQGLLIKDKKIRIKAD